MSTLHRNQNNTILQSHYRLPFLPLPPADCRANAALPFPWLANLTALRTLRTSPSPFFAFFAESSLWSFDSIAKLCDFSATDETSVGSNYTRFKFVENLLMKQVIETKRTLRLTPFNFFSPSSFLSNLPMLAVLVLVVASVLSISCFR